MTSRKIPLKLVAAPRNRCRFRGPARVGGERTLCGLYLRPLRRRPAACRRGPSSRGPDPLQKMRIV